MAGLLAKTKLLPLILKAYALLPHNSRINDSILNVHEFCGYSPCLCEFPLGYLVSFYLQTNILVCFCRLWIYCDPEQDKPVTEDGWMNNFVYFLTDRKKGIYLLSSHVMHWAHSLSSLSSQLFLCFLMVALWPWACTMSVYGLHSDVIYTDMHFYIASFLGICLDFVLWFVWHLY